MRVHTIIRIQIEDILLSPGKGTQYCTIVIFEKSSSFGDTGRVPCEGGATSTVFGIHLALGPKVFESLLTSLNITVFIG